MVIVASFSVVLLTLTDFIFSVLLDLLTTSLVLVCLCFETGFYEIVKVVKGECYDQWDC